MFGVHFQYMFDICLSFNKFIKRTIRPSPCRKNIVIFWVMLYCFIKIFNCLTVLVNLKFTLTSTKQTHTILWRKFESIIIQLNRFNKSWVSIFISHFLSLLSYSLASQTKHIVFVNFNIARNFIQEFVNKPSMIIYHFIIPRPINVLLICCDNCLYLMHIITSNLMHLTFLQESKNCSYFLIQYQFIPDFLNFQLVGIHHLLQQSNHNIQSLLLLFEHCEVLGKGQMVGKLQKYAEGGLPIAYFEGIGVVVELQAVLIAGKGWLRAVFS